jgi:hypothetical protein
MDVLANRPVSEDSEVFSFNGQKGRKQICNDIRTHFPIEKIIETGTFVGDTTGYMATVAGLPVITTEFNRFLYSLAKKKTAKCCGNIAAPS